MTSSAPDPAAADPMLRVLRERHPEVDVVVLPAPVPPRPDTPTLDSEQLAHLAAEADSLVGDLLARLARSPHWTGGRRSGRWRSDEWGQVSYESVATVEDVPEGGPVPLLRDTGAALVDLGWQARPLPSARPGLEARRPGFRATARVRRDGVVVRVRSVPVRAHSQPAGSGPEVTR